MSEVRIRLASAWADATREIRDLDLQALNSVTMGGLVEGADLLHGGPDFWNTRSVAENALRANTDETWQAIAATTVGEALAWSGVGPTKVRGIIELLAQASRGAVPSVEQLEPASASAASDDVPGLRVAAAWGLVNGCGSIVETVAKALDHADDPGVLLWLSELEGVDLRVLAGDAARIFDPLAVIEEFTETLSDRDRRIIEGRFAVAVERRLTLAALGAEFDVSRERIRQEESRLAGFLEEFLQRPANGALRERVGAIRSEMGILCPATAGAPELEAADDSLHDELIAYLAGPYALSDGFYRSAEAPEIDELVLGSFELVTDGNVVEVAALCSELEQRGVAEAHALAVANSCAHIRVIGDEVLDWRRGVQTRAVSVLEHLGEPATAEHIHSFMADEVALNTLKNGLSENPQVRRVSKDRFGLAEWGGERYDGVVPSMISAIEDAGTSVELELLAANLADRFGVSDASVRIMAGTHPAFVCEGATVRLRRVDEPYEPKGSLSTARECFFVNGTWTLRMEVDRDVLRGSGRSIPESFADHLGVRPGYSTRVSLNDGDVWLGWYQSPMIGSVRTAVANVGAEEGDVVFVGQDPGGGLRLRLGQQAEGNDPRVRLLGLIGATDLALDDWYPVLSMALGFGMALPARQEEIEERLRSRSDDVLLALFAEALAGD